MPPVTYSSASAGTPGAEDGCGVLKQIVGVSCDRDCEDGAAGLQARAHEYGAPDVEKVRRNLRWRCALDCIQDAQGSFAGKRQGSVHELVLAVGKVVVDGASRRA